MSEADVLASVHQRIGYQFHDPDLLCTALTHSSVSDTRLASNERLEFLGDAVLGTVVCEELYRRFGHWLEGDLTKVKSVVVSRQVCAKVADEAGLSGLLVLGNGIDVRGALPMSIRAAVFEAMIGAMYLDGGLDPTREFVLKAISPHIDQCCASAHQDNYKSTLQQLAQRWLSATPHYESLDEQGPDHSKCFEICVVVAGRRFPSAWGPSKKEAEQKAAQRALQALRASGSSGEKPATP
ncbi:MAG: ribonuclease III [Planctomycetota bacterium]|jgi:ribonuclease-3